MQGFRLKVADTRKDRSKRGFYAAYGVRQGSRDFGEETLWNIAGISYIGPGAQMVGTSGNACVRAAPVTASAAISIAAS